MENTPATTKPKAEITIRDRLEGDAFKAAVAKALPRHLTPDRFIRVACTAIMKTPKLGQCDQTSFFNALLTLSQLGIEPDGRRAHLIPFENKKRGCTEVQLMIDYKGLAELIIRSGLVSYLHADVVCDKDDFEYNRGELVKHTINFREPRGAIYAAYCICKFKDGSEKCDVMSVDEIEAIRSRSRAAQSGPWVTDWSEMAKKTVFRRLSKWLPLSPEFRDAIESDEDTTIDISPTSFETEAQPKSKPHITAKSTAETTEPEAPVKPKASKASAPKPSPTPPPPEETAESAEAPANTDQDSQGEDGGLGPVSESPVVGSKFDITPELKAKLDEMGVTYESFDKWVTDSGRADAFNADGDAASAKLLSEERSLKKLQTLYGAE